MLETINEMGLRDENIYPDETVLGKVLGRSHEAYIKLLELFGAYGLESGWRYYHDGKAWLCKVQKKKRTIVWMSAWKDYMKATMYFPEKYIDKVFELEISDEAKQKIHDANKTGKSTPCIFEIRNEESLVDFEKVMKLKIECK